MQSARTLLDELPLFRSLSHSELDTLATYSTILNYDEGAVLYEPEKPFDYIGIIVQGKVNYFFHSPTLDKAIKVGSYKRYPVGIFNLGEHKQSIVLAKAAEPTVILAIRTEYLDDLEKQMPRLTSRIYKGFTRLQLQINSRLMNLIIDRFGKKIRR
jgi:signal-transduction protein with cAMP-binding, CBS, and nucleotidyltransferase domain